MEERRRLRIELEEQKIREQRLRAETKALQSDPFYLQRVLIETWKAKPKGAIALDRLGRVNEE